MTQCHNTLIFNMKCTCMLKMANKALLLLYYVHLTMGLLSTVVYLPHVISEGTRFFGSKHCTFQ